MNLIADLEQAPTGSRELDGRIALVLGWRKGLGKGWAHWIAPGSEPEIVDDDGTKVELGKDMVPFFTESFDDAYKVLPPGFQSISLNISENGNELACGTIVNASTSEGIFFETINAAVVLQVPMVMSVCDDEYGISVHAKHQTTKENISEILKGFQRDENTNVY